MKAIGRGAVLVFLAALVGFAPQAQAETAKDQNAAGNLNVLMGVRLLTDDDFWNINPNIKGHFDDQQLGGLIFDFAITRSLLGIEIGGLYSFDDAVDGTAELSGSVLEGFAGLRKTWDINGFRPYGAIGLTFLQAAYEIEDPNVLANNLDVDDGSIAAYGHIGFLYRVGNHFNVGAAFRYTIGSAIEFEVAPGVIAEGDADNVAIGMQFGFGW